MPESSEASRDATAEKVSTSSCTSIAPAPDGYDSVVRSGHACRRSHAYRKTRTAGTSTQVVLKVPLVLDRLLVLGRRYTAPAAILDRASFVHALG